MNLQNDQSVITTSVALLSGLALLATVLFMLAALMGVFSDVAPEDNLRKQTFTLERIKPVTRVSFEQPKPAVAVKLTGQQVYNNACAACHAAGVLNAPKLGVKDQWEARVAQGLDTLVNHAVNGIRAMPAKGGNPALTEENIRESIVYMLNETGFKTDAAPVAAESPK